MYPVVPTVPAVKSVLANRENERKHFSIDKKREKHSLNHLLLPTDGYCLFFNNNNNNNNNQEERVNEELLLKMLGWRYGVQEITTPGEYDNGGTASSTSPFPCNLPDNYGGR